MIPSMPLNFTLVSTDRHELTFAWEAPLVEGGIPITDYIITYEIEVRPVAGSRILPCPPPSPPCSLTCVPFSPTRGDTTACLSLHILGCAVTVALDPSFFLFLLPSLPYPPPTYTHAHSVPCPS